MLVNQSKAVLLGAVLLFLAACGRSHESANNRSGNPDSAAGKGGKAAYKVAKETEKAAKVVGRELDKAAHDVHAGWKDASQEDKAKRDR
jgi:hypothetical protein